VMLLIALVNCLAFSDYCTLASNRRDTHAYKSLHFPLAELKELGKRHDP
jgi:hypothetical protein